MSSVQVTDNSTANLLPNVTGAESTSSSTKFRCYYIHNNHGTLSLVSPKLWIAQSTSSPDDEVDIGLGTSGVGSATSEPLTSAGSPNDTAPSGVSFTHAVVGSELSIPDIPAGQHKAFWLRRTVNAGSAAYSGNTFQLSISGETGS